MIRIFTKTVTSLALVLALFGVLRAETFSREFKFDVGGTVEVVNRFGRVTIVAAKPAETDVEVDTAVEKPPSRVVLHADGNVYEREIKIDASSGKISIDVDPGSLNKRVDISIEVPERSKVRIETGEGEINVAGDLTSIDAITETGTIAVDVPTVDLKYNFLWTASRPRFVSDIAMSKVKEKSGGKFELKGKFADAEARTSVRAKSPDSKDDGSESVPPASAGGSNESVPPAVAGGLTEGSGASSKDKEQKPKDNSVSLTFTTARGIVLLNVPQNEVMSDLRERPLTNAAKAIVRSGDSVLMDAIRRASPKYFGDYSRTLPPMRREPVLTEREKDPNTSASVKRVTARVTDINNRAISGLKPEDFELTENGAEREIVNVQPVTAPFNLVLLVDVSGSVENYVTFIRKAARAFVDTVGRNDRVSIVLFNDDVKVLSGFTTDKAKLSSSLDSFDAGGATAYYDAVAYTLAETLRPMKGDRTAIVILTDGDDNRSFLSFDSLMGAIEESGALIYPLYVPSALIAASANSGTSAELDPLRYRYINTSLTSKAQSEGPQLAKVSGGVYYPITRLSQIQTAYDDIVVQLRTAYSITYRSASTEAVGNHVSPRVKIKVKKEGSFVSLGPITAQ
ncbi:MAG TPA: VWA domain-containing protein [Pyrinomonadaceae bacterium]|nr:VWA domain-containing protein [Pyrinomonadaceae bacterium]